MNYPSKEEAAALICEIGRRMYQRAYVAANDGNISCRLSENTILTTPTGVSKGFLKEDEMVEMDLEGNILAMGARKPSSEVKMHLRVYLENPLVGAVTHAHPLAATTFAIAGRPLKDALLTEGVVNLGVVPVVHYATPGTQEVPDSIAPFCRDYNAVLLANHGALTWGRDLIEAFYRMESLECLAGITLNLCALGQANKLDHAQVDALLTMRKNLGYTSGGRPDCVEYSENHKDFL